MEMEERTLPSSLLVVGKASAFIESLKEDFPDIRLIAESELDLNRTDLVKPKQYYFHRLRSSRCQPDGLIGTWINDPGGIARYIST